MGNLNYPLDNQSQVIIERAVDKFLAQKVFDANLIEYFYYLTLFESLDGLGGATATTDTTFTGVVMATTSSSGNDQQVGRDLQHLDGTVTYTRTSKFRTAVLFNQSTSQEFFVGLGNGKVRPVDDIYGFELINSTLRGITANGTSETKVDLITISSATQYSLEARFTPNESVIFLVDNKEVGVITTTLPTGLVATMPFYYLKTTTSATRQVDFGYFEYMQLRDNQT